MAEHQNRPPFLGSSTPARVVFTADDLGLAESVNDSILAAAQHGLLKSASLLVTFEGARHALHAASVSDHPPCLGLHFSLTSGTPVAPPKEIPLLVGPDGRFRHGFLGLAKLLLSRRRIDALPQIAVELAAQLSRLDALTVEFPGLIFDHLDSHQHIHVLPGIEPLLAEVADRRNLVLRSPSEPFGGWSQWFSRSPIHRGVGLAKRSLLDYFIRKGEFQKNHALLRAGRFFPPLRRSTAEERLPTEHHKPFSPRLRYRPKPVYFGLVDSGRMSEPTLLRILDRIADRRDRYGETLFEINLHPWRTDGAFSANPLSSECSEADRKFAGLPWRQVEWNAMVRPGLLLEKMAQRRLVPATFFAGDEASSPCEKTSNE